MARLKTGSTRYLRRELKRGVSDDDHLPETWEPGPHPETIAGPILRYVTWGHEHGEALAAIVLDEQSRQTFLLWVDTSPIRWFWRRLKPRVGDRIAITVGETGDWVPRCERVNLEAPGQYREPKPASVGALLDPPGSNGAPPAAERALMAAIRGLEEGLREAN